MVKKTLATILTLALLFQLSACSAGNVSKKTRYEAQFLKLFDTMTTIIGYTETKEEFTNFSNLIYNNLKIYHQLYDIYDNYPGINNIKTINDNAGKKPVKVDKKIIDLLLLAKNANKLSNGACNVALGPVLQIWHNYREAGIADPDNAKLPPMSDLKAAMQHTDINKVIIDEKASTVYLEDPKMSLDVGSAAKGYATEQVCQIAIAHGYTSGLISVGGNIRAIGNKGVNNEQWNVGIQNPDLSSDQKSLNTVLLTDESLVSSGVYERYYTVNGKNYHHIIDPTTLMPSTNYKQVTLLCKDSGKADSLSTAVFNMPFERALKFINSMPDMEAMWVFPDGSIKYSKNFQKYIKK